MNDIHPEGLQLGSKYVNEQPVDASSSWEAAGPMRVVARNIVKANPPQAMALIRVRMRICFKYFVAVVGVHPQVRPLGKHESSHHGRILGVKTNRT